MEWRIYDTTESVRMDGCWLVNLKEMAKFNQCATIPPPLLPRQQLSRLTSVQPITFSWAKYCCSALKFSLPVNTTPRDFSTVAILQNFPGLWVGSKPARGTSLVYRASLIECRDQWVLRAWGRQHKTTGPTLCPDFGWTLLEAVRFHRCPNWSVWVNKSLVNAARLDEMKTIW